MVAAASELPDSLDDIEDVRSKLQELAAAGRIDELIELVLDLLLRVRKDNNDLAVQLKGALRQLYGRRSEKVSGAQLSLLFNQLGKEVPDSAHDALTSTLPAEPVPQPSHKPRPLKGKQGRSPLPEGLPREPDRQLVPKDQRTCAACGTEKKTIGFLSSEILEFVPARFKVIDQEREKIACPSCESGVQIADSQKVMERGRPGPGLLAHILVSKHADALPLYRQSQIYDRYGVHLPDATLGEWCAFAIDVMRPVAILIARCALRSPYIHLDDTTLRLGLAVAASGLFVATIALLTARARSSARTARAIAISGLCLLGATAAFVAHVAPRLRSGLVPGPGGVAIVLALGCAAWLFRARRTHG